MAGAEVTGTELYDQMSGESTDMTMRQGPDLFQETYFGGTPLPGPPAEEQPVTPVGGQPAPPDAPDLGVIDLGDFQYSTATSSEKILLGSVSTWVKAVRRAYNYNPGTKTRIDIRDFKRDKDGLMLLVVDGGRTREVRYFFLSRVLGSHP
jgi:hypothetical protein